MRQHFGKSGVVDLKPLIDKGGVFSDLRDIEAFKSFSIDTEWHERHTTARATRNDRATRRARRPLPR